MTPEAVLRTAVLLGLLTLAAFGYGGCYTVARLYSLFALRYGALVCYALVAALAVLVAVTTPLAPGWKALVVVSALVYAAVPPFTWRFLVRLHAPEEQGS